ncbi:MAG: creatininase family protein [bacterium]
MLLKDMKWPEVREEIAKGTVVIVPVGSTEEHGHHLPLDTDVAITTHIAERAAERAGAIVAPPVNYGYNEKELDFPGTASVKAETLIRYLYDICNSLVRSGLKRVLILNGHGWNTGIIDVVQHMINEMGDALCASASYWDLIPKDVVKEVRESRIPGGMSHSCEFETSIQLHLNPERVDMTKAVREIGFQETPFTFFDLLEQPPVRLRTSFSKNTKSGVIGDPTLATKEKGERLVEAAVERLAEFLRLFKEEISH